MTRPIGRQQLTLVVVVVAIVMSVLLAPAGADAQVTDSPTTIEPPSQVPEAPESNEPGLFDISGKVSGAIDDWFKGLVTSAINPVLELLGQSLLSSPNVTEQGQVRRRPVQKFTHHCDVGVANGHGLLVRSLVSMSGCSGLARA